MRFRVNDEEREEICRAAARKGMSYGTFIVHTVLLNARGESGGNAGNYELCEELRAVARQLNRIGVNLNQLARVANSTGKVPEELHPALDYLKLILQRLEAAAIEAGRRLR